MTIIKLHAESAEHDDSNIGIDSFFPSEKCSALARRDYLLVAPVLVEGLEFCVQGPALPSRGARPRNPLPPLGRQETKRVIPV
jgi:hypothetical protein